MSSVGFEFDSDATFVQTTLVTGTGDDTDRYDEFNCRLAGITANRSIHLYLTGEEVRDNHTTRDQGTLVVSGEKKGLKPDPDLDAPVREMGTFTLSVRYKRDQKEGSRWVVGPAQAGQFTSKLEMWFQDVYDFDLRHGVVYDESYKIRNAATGPHSGGSGGGGGSSGSGGSSGTGTYGKGSSQGHPGVVTNVPDTQDD